MLGGNIRVAGRLGLARQAANRSRIPYDMAKAPQPARRYGIQVSLMSSESRCPCPLSAVMHYGSGRFLRLYADGGYAETCRTRRNLCIREGVRILYTHPLCHALCIHTYRSRKRTHPRIRTRVCIRTHCVYAPTARVNAPTRVYNTLTCVYAPAAYTHPCLRIRTYLRIRTHPRIRTHRRVQAHMRIRRDATNVMLYTGSRLGYLTSARAF
jgi:hypothetical protein